jgi:hypothetical protein
MIFYGILDVLAKPVYTMIHLFSLSKLDLTALQLSSGKFSSSAVGPAVHDVEKHGRFNNNTVAGENTHAAPAKKGFFSKKGKYDATNTTVVNNEPRRSEATAVSQ